MKILTILKAGIIASIYNVILLAIARAIFVYPETFAPFWYSSVVTLTFGGVVLAGIVYYFMASVWKKFPNRSVNRDYTVLALVLLVLSFIPDALLPYSPDADNAGATFVLVIVLMVLHIPPAWASIKYFAKGK